MIDTLSVSKFYEDVHTKINLLSQSSIIQCELINYLSEDNYKSTFRELAKASKVMNADCIILDLRRFYGTTFEMQEWTNRIWPKTVKDFSIKSISIVLPRSIAGYFSVLNSIGEIFNASFKVKKFIDYESAIHWIRSEENLY